MSIFRGTCPVCEMVRVFSGETMGTHLDLRPGGKARGICFGSKYPPFEVSPRGSQDYRAFCLKRLEALSGKPQTNEVTSLTKQHQTEIDRMDRLTRKWGRR